MNRFNFALSSSIVLAFAMVVGLGLFSACTQETATNQVVHEHTDDHSHDGPEADHSHGDEESEDDHHAGEEHELGTIMIGSYEVLIGQKGDLHPGEEGLLTIAFTQEPESIAAIRAWIGNEQADGVRKESAEKEDESNYHAHVMVPETVADDAQAWIEIQTSDGERLRNSVDFHHHD